MTYTNLIQKRTPATLLEFISTTPSSAVLFVTIIMLILVSLCLKQLHHKSQKIDTKQPFYKIELVPIQEEIIALKGVAVVISLIGISSLCYFAHNLHDYYEHDSTIWTHTTLADIKNQVHINDNKLTIDPLPENYMYNANFLTRDEPHDFQIVKNDFYQDEEIKLIDKKQREYKIPSKDFDDLMRK